MSRYEMFAKQLIGAGAVAIIGCIIYSNVFSSPEPSLGTGPAILFISLGGAGVIFAGLCMLWRIYSDEFDEEHKKDNRDKKDGWR